MATTSRTSRLRQSLRLRLGSAHQSTGLVALLALGFGLVSLVTQPPNRDTVHSPLLWLMITAALSYTLATIASQWTWGHQLRTGHASNGRTTIVLRAAAALGVVASLLVVLARGPQSNVLLTRIETLLTLVGTIATVVFVLAVIDLATQAAPGNQTTDASDHNSIGSATATDSKRHRTAAAADWLGSLAAGAFVLAILWAELSGVG